MRLGLIPISTRDVCCVWMCGEREMGEGVREEDVMRYIPSARREHAKMTQQHPAVVVGKFSRNVGRSSLLHSTHTAFNARQKDIWSRHKV